MSKNVNTLTDDNYVSLVLESKLPVVVYFWAIWCGPCVRLGPVVEGLADEFAGRINVGKINADDNPKATTRNNILGLPTVLIYKDGELVNRFTGNITRRTLLNAIDVVLN